EPNFGKESSYFDREIAQLSEVKAGAAMVKDGEPFKFRSGAVYKGQWKNGMREGIGKQTWPDGASFVGQWVANKAQGNGQFLHSDGDIYIG
ncbi:RSP1, partial [Symbiodinium pilosum]